MLLSGLVPLPPQTRTPIAQASEGDLGAGRFAAVTPYRLADSRNNTGTTGGALGPGASRAVQVTSVTAGRVPATATGVVVDVTAVTPTATGFLTIWPDGEARPYTSFLNFTAATNTSNSAMVKLGPTGKLQLFNSSGTTHFVIDVQGYFTGAGDPQDKGVFHAVHPERVLDTRDAAGAHPYQVAPFETYTFDVWSDVIPSSGVQGLVMNVTVIAPPNGGYVTLWDPSAARPGVSSMDFAANQTVSSAVVVKGGSDSTVSIFNGSAGAMHLTVDVQGWFSRTTTTGAGGFFTPMSPVRIVDTRYGTGGIGTIPATRTAEFTAIGVGGIPAVNVDSLMVNVTIVAPGNGGYVTAWQGLTERPLASSMNFVSGTTRANFATIRVGSDGGTISLYNGSAYPMDVIVDVYGWFHTHRSSDPRCGFDRLCDDSIGSASTPAADAALAQFPSAAVSDEQVLVIPPSEPAFPSSPGDFAVAPLAPEVSSDAIHYPSDYHSRTNVEQPYGQPEHRSVSFRAWWGSSFKNCSGFMYGRNMIATAAHCVYDRKKGGYLSDYEVFPSAWYSYRYGRSVHPFPRCEMNPGQAFAPKGWRKNHDLVFDFAALRVRCPSPYGDRLGDYTGMYGISNTYADSLGGRNVGLLGYPYKPLNDKPNALLRGDGPVYRTGRHKSRFYFKVKVAGGDSGSPVYLWDEPGRQMVVGITSYMEQNSQGYWESVARKMTGYSVGELARWRDCLCGAT